MLRQGWNIEIIASGNFAIYAVDDANAFDPVSEMKLVLEGLYGDRIRKKRLHEVALMMDEFFQDFMIDDVRFNIGDEFGITSVIPYEATGNRYIMEIAKALGIVMDYGIFANLAKDLLRKTKLYDPEICQTYISNILAGDGSDQVPSIRIREDCAEVTVCDCGKVVLNQQHEDLRKPLYILLHYTVSGMTKQAVHEKYSAERSGDVDPHERESVIQALEEQAFRKINGVYREWYHAGKTYLNMD